MAPNKLTSGLGIEGARVASLLHLQDALDPRDDLVRTRIGRFVQIDVARLDVLLDVAVERGRAKRQRCVVIGADVQLVKVLEQQRPLGRLEFGNLVRGFDEEVAGLLNFAQIVDRFLFDLLGFAFLLVRC